MAWIGPERKQPHDLSRRTFVATAAVGGTALASAMKGFPFVAGPFFRQEADNFIPEAQEAAYRTALWREFLRFVGEDFSEFFSEIPVTVLGEPGGDRDRLVGLCASVLADFELRPVLEFADADEEGPNPQLVIGDTTVAKGLPSRRSMKATIRQRLSDW